MARVMPTIMFLLAPQACWSLRKSKLRAMRQQPVTPPSEISDLVELTNEFQLGELCTGKDWITDMAGNSLAKKNYGTCALVGSGEALAGKSNGALIDSHDTVIRINRIPRTVDSNDTLEVGARTDVFFGGPVADSRDLWTFDGYDVYSFSNSEVHRCMYDKGDCPVGGVVLNNGIVDVKNWRFGDVYPKWHPGWVPESSIFPLARQSDTVYYAVRQLVDVALHGKRPTSGFQAFFTFLPMCDSITLFGFRGEGTYDNHAISQIHNITAEHMLMRAINNGQLPSQYLGLRDVPPPLRRIEECMKPHLEGNAILVNLHDADFD
eukprot:CAMPEP_0197900900 /NCGR_PEP_ID=MMETSP1439-20131203/50229_1 /TAXON_ID=66791 /ORGANISM="Gonyaulax spinifera, Strain CCMP409" /LENGTH=320 /DNA_ID=CAMNT_0043521841 /DNA_START=87 /DNA_END=1049 /DNA_ORIENTATION=-